MSAEKRLLPCITRCYRITVEGKIDPSWSDWLSGIRIVSRKEADERTITTLSGILVDQAALRGLLNRLWDLNLIVRSVEQVDPTSTLNNK